MYVGGVKHAETSRLVRIGWEIIARENETVLVIWIDGIDTVEW